MTKVPDLSDRGVVVIGGCRHPEYARLVTDKPVADIWDILVHSALI